MVTQIEIEAASRAIRKLYREINEDTPIKYLDVMAQAALTAAAEVNRGVQTGKALTGNPNEVSLGENSESVLHNQTIERCAQVAKRKLMVLGHSKLAEPVAAAIRAEKHEP